MSLIQVTGHPSNQLCMQSFFKSSFIIFETFLQMLVPNGIDNLFTLNRYKFRLVSVLFPRRLFCLPRLRLVMNVELT